MSRMRSSLAAGWIRAACVAVGAWWGLGGPARADLVAYYSLNNKTVFGRAVVDASGNRHDGRFTLQVTPGEPGRFRQSFYLDGTPEGSQVDIQCFQRAPFGNTFSLSLWFKTSDLGQSEKYLLHRGTAFSDQNSIIFGYLPSTVEFFAPARVGDDPRPGSQIAVTAADAWNNIVYTYDASNFRGYLNGELIFDNDLSFSLTSPNDLYLGSSGNFGYGGNFEGFIDDISVWDRALTQEEIAYYQTQPVRPPSAAQTLFAVNEDEELLLIDAHTAVPTVVGPLGIELPDVFVGLDFYGNELYLGVNSARQLYRIDTRSGAATLVAVVPSTIENMAFAPIRVPGPNGTALPRGTLFASAVGDLHAFIDRDSVIDIGNTSFDDDALAFSPRGVLYGFDTSQTDTLYLIDTRTAEATPIGTIRGEINVLSLAWANRSLYAVSQLSGHLLRINPITGAAIVIGTTERGIIGLAARELRWPRCPS